MERLRRRRDFLAVGRGQRIPSQSFVLQMSRQRSDPEVRLGFTVSRKVGTAVERNRVRRRLKEAVRLSGADLAESGADYVLVAKRSVLDAPFGRLCSELQSALRRARRRMQTKSAVEDGTE